MYKFRLVLIGDILLPQNINDTFSKEGFLITKVGGPNSYFEMSGESLYYALKEIERRSNQKMTEYLSQVVSAIIRRVELCGGVLKHKSLAQNGERDTQLRASSSAIRTLLMAKKDGYEVEDILIKMIEYHYSYYFKWRDGIWFCHDTSEKDGIKPRTHLKTRAAGKEDRNTLTLNTHLDSLSTLLIIKKYYSDIELSFSIDEYINRGILSINQLFDIRGYSLSTFIQKVDNCILKHIGFSNMGFLERVWARIIHPFCFKFLNPTVFFNNGFIARDLAVMNIHMDYLVVNIVDFARFMVLYREMCPKLNLKYDLLLERIMKAVDLIEREKNIRNFILSSELLDAWYAEMYFTLSNLDARFLPKAKLLAATTVYCTYSPFFNDFFNEN